MTPIERGEAAARLKPGDILHPVPFWNRMARADKLPSKCTVLRTAYEWASQTGTMVTVQARNGHEITIDAGWFTEFAGGMKPPKEPIVLEFSDDMGTVRFTSEPDGSMSVYIDNPYAGSEPRVGEEATGALSAREAERLRDWLIQHYPADEKGGSGTV